MQTEQVANWKQVTLGAIAEFINGRAFKPEEWETKGKMIIRIQDLTSSSDSPNFTTKTFEEKYLVRKGDLLISWSATLDAFIWNRKEGWLNQHIFKVKENKALVDRKFLFYWVRHKINDFKRQTHGSTMKHITKDRFIGIKLLLPPLHVQHKIVAILEKVELAKELRSNADALTQQFLKAVFLKMFTDKFPTRKLSELSSKISSGSTPLGGSENYLTHGKILFIRSQNVLMNKFSDHDNLYISDEIHQKMKRTWVKKYDVLLNITGASIGRTAIYMGEDDKANVNQHVCIIRIRNIKELNPIYLNYYLSSDKIQAYIQSINAGGTREALNYSQIKDFAIPIPPISSQQKFAAIVKAVEKTKEQQKQSQEYIDNLFNNLMQKSFKGELTC